MTPEEHYLAGRALQRLMAAGAVTISGTTPKAPPPSDYANRRARGLCTKCGLKAFLGMSLCAPCGVKGRQNVRVREGWKRKETRRGGVPVYPGEGRE